MLPVGLCRLLRSGCVHKDIFVMLRLLRKLWRYPVFFWYVLPVVPFRKGVAVIINIALFGEHAPVIYGSVAPVFLKRSQRRVQRRYRANNLTAGRGSPYTFQHPE